ncbi:MAG: glutamyl-tRNA reductase [Methanobacteriaceae archaeon]|nr:glutamyl-tRNA reductase [Methanobacteriaceae archaeon]
MILNIRIDYKIADIKTMENSYKKLDELNQQLNQEYNIKEQITLKTCNRYEIYMILEDDIEVPVTGFIIEKDDGAVNHLLRLASGLESMILGEDQILGQIKNARKKAIKEKTIGKKLEKIFTKAIHVGQSVRKNTQINQGGVSIGSGAVELIEQKKGAFNNEKILIIGAGEMGTVVAKALLEKNINAMIVANRTFDKAQQLAEELSGKAITFDKLTETIPKIDIIISATGAPHPIINYDRIKDIPREKLENKIMIDLANPHDINEDVQKKGIKLYNLDDLRYITDKNKTKRELEAKKVEKIIETEFKLLKKSLKQQEIEPIISSINIESNKIREKELEKTLHMINLNQEDTKIIENLTHSIVDKMLYNIINNLKQAADNNDTHTIKKASKLLIKYEK